MKIYKQVMILALGGITQNAHGLVFLNSGDPNYNTTAPSGAMANPWNSMGSYNGGGGGTAISSRWFISASHVGNGGTFVVNGQTYNVVEDYVVGGNSDITFHKVDRDFSTWANIWTGDPRTLVTSGNSRDQLLLIGNGYARGTAVYDSQGALQGYNTDGWQHKSWALNTVDRISYSTSTAKFSYYSYFANNNYGDSEAMVAPGDSGGGAFVQKNGAWYLLGTINSALTVPGYPWAAINLSQSKGTLVYPYLNTILSGTDIGNFDSVPGVNTTPVPEPEDAALAACAALGGYFIGRRGPAKKKAPSGTRVGRFGIPSRHRRCDPARATVVETESAPAC